MSEPSRKPLREHLSEKVAALASLRSIADVTAPPEAPGGTVAAEGRAWFSARALAQGIDLGERIHSQF